MVSLLMLGLRITGLAGAVDGLWITGLTGAVDGLEITGLTGAVDGWWITGLTGAVDGLDIICIGLSDADGDGVVLSNTTSFKLTESGFFFENCVMLEILSFSTLKL